MDKNIENRILTDVENGYDLVAEKFSQTRKYFWPEFEFISNYLKKGDRLFDFGCGNGRFLEIVKNKEIEYFGVDVSAELIKLAKEKYSSKKVSFYKLASSLKLPFSDNFFNKIVSISVFHHFPQKYAREMARELNRVMLPGGVIIVSVWNLRQKKYLKYFFDFHVIWKKIFQSGEMKGLGLKDILIPFKDNQGQVFNRFHHIFSRQELVEIFKLAGFKVDKCFVLNEKNIVLIAKKQ